MKQSELLRLWHDFLLKKGSTFALTETHDVSEGILRGPISGITIIKDTLVIRTYWTARQPKGSAPNQWYGYEGSEFNHILGEYTSVPQEQDEGRVYFKSDFRDNYLYPNNHPLAQRLMKP